MEQDDYSIVKQVISGQQAAYQVIVERYQNYVFTVAMRVLNNREEAEESAQDTFIKAYQTLKTFRGESKFSTWLYTIAYRTAIDTARKKKLPIQSIDGADDYLQIADQLSDLPTNKLMARDMSEKLKSVIALLKPEDATLITLYYLHEKSVKEIVDITGLSKSNVKVKLFRLRETLKKLLERHLEEEIKEYL